MDNNQIDYYYYWSMAYVSKARSEGKDSTLIAVPSGVASPVIDKLQNDHALTVDLAVLKLSLMTALQAFKRV